MQINPKKINYRDRNLVFIDLELTGLDPNIHEIIEIACIQVDGRSFENKKTYSKKIKPLHLESANPESLKIAGYSEDKWKHADDLSVALEEVNVLNKDGMFVGWNIASDWAFLDKAFYVHGTKPLFDYHCIDVMTMAYAHFYSKKEPVNLRLRTIAKYYDIKLGSEVHSALEDAMATYQIFKKLMAV